jgi:protein ImuA
LESLVLCDSSIIQNRGYATPAPTQTHILSEVFATNAADAACVGFGVASLPRGTAPLLWAQDRLSRQETGQPYLPGLPGRSIIRVDVSRAVDVLWAMEEALKCTSLGAIIGEIWGDPKQLDFTATKRLAMRAEHYGMPCWLIRRAASPDLSAARDRWRVMSLPSLQHPDDSKAPGDPRWQVELFRSRHRAPGTWIATYDRAADRLDMSAPFRDRAVAEGDGARERRTAR